MSRTTLGTDGHELRRAKQKILRKGTQVAWLEAEARKAKRPKSALVREILQARQRRRPTRSALDMARDLCGSVQSGICDLGHNRKHLKGFGQ